MTSNWTIMVCISGDGVLDNFAVESLKQLRDGSGKRVTVHYLFDPNFNGDLPKSASFDKPNKDKNASVFEGSKNRPPFLAKILRGKESRIDIVDPTVLREFIDSVIPPPNSLASARKKKHHYGLILWGHGPELLLDAEQPKKGEAGAGSGRNYFTPATLRAALAPKSTERGQKPGEQSAAPSRIFDFIAFDACSMSMVEFATELQDYADFMIASQDDVPDQSFPYDRILSLLKERSGAREACRRMPEEYKNAYRDYFPAPGPAATNITLTSLNLRNMDKITGHLKELTAALQRLAYTSAGARRAIIGARRASRDFVLGLFVDIFEFCQNLENANIDNSLNTICQQICAALTVSSAKDGLVLNNQTNEEEEEMRCHGLSVYLPYLTAAENNDIQKSLTIGGIGIAPHVSKNASTTNLHKNASTTNLHKNASTTNLHKVRAARIAQTEKDLASLKRFNEETGWKDFIKDTWSYILVKQEPSRLDLHYSAEQCALNLRSRLALPGKSNGSLRNKRLREIAGRGKRKRPGKSENPNLSEKKVA